MTTTQLVASPPAPATHYLRWFAGMAVVLIAIAIAFAIGRATVDSAHATVVPASTPAVAQPFQCPRAGVC